MKKTILFLAILLSLLFIQSLPAQAQATGPYDVILAVNQFRNANGLPALQIDGSLMAAAPGTQRLPGLHWDRHPLQR